MNIVDSEFARYVAVAVRRDPFWEQHWAEAVADSTVGFRIHLGIFVQPYLDHILNGRKTIESRFSATRIAPYRSAAPGDVLLMKEAGGPILGMCRIARAWFYRLDPASWREIRDTYAAAMCAEDPDFWSRREGAAYATLMELSDVRGLPPIEIPKADRRGWVVLKEVVQQLDLNCL